MDYSKMTKKELIQIIEEKEGAKLSVEEFKRQLEKLQRQNEILQQARKEDREKIIAGEEADNKLKAFIENYNNQIQEAENVYGIKINELTQQYNQKLGEVTEFYENKINNITNMIEEQNQTVIMLFDLIDTSHEMQQKYYKNFKSLIISDTKEN